MGRHWRRIFPSVHFIWVIMESWWYSDWVLSLSEQTRIRTYSSSSHEGAGAKLQERRNVTSGVDFQRFLRAFITSICLSLELWFYESLIRRPIIIIAELSKRYYNEPNYTPYPVSLAQPFLTRIHTGVCSAPSPILFSYRKLELELSSFYPYYCNILTTCISV